MALGIGIGLEMPNASDRRRPSHLWQSTRTQTRRLTCCCVARSGRSVHATARPKWQSIRRRANIERVDSPALLEFGSGAVRIASAALDQRNWTTLPFRSFRRHHDRTRMVVIDRYSTSLAKANMPSQEAHPCNAPIASTNQPATPHLSTRSHISSPLAKLFFLR